MYIKVAPTISLSLFIYTFKCWFFLWLLFFNNFDIIKVMFTYQIPTNYVKHMYLLWWSHFNCYILIVGQNRILWTLAKKKNIVYLSFCHVTMPLTILFMIWMMCAFIHVILSQHIYIVLYNSKIDFHQFLLNFKAMDFLIHFQEPIVYPLNAYMIRSKPKMSRKMCVKCSVWLWLANGM